MLTESEFNVLYYMLKNPANHTQRALADATGYSLGKINKLNSSLSDRGLVDINGITDSGRQELDFYKVDNAIIMAAGMSSRFAPLSYEKPKGLLKVKGEILIEREIEQLLEAGIKDITIVIGYMKERFFYLKDKYNVKLVVNADYYRYNNSSTVYSVMGDFSNTYLCSSDNYFTKNVFESHVYHAYYSAIYGEGRTEEYCMQFDNHGRITDVTVGGSDAWYMLGHVYFDKKFSRKFIEILKEQYQYPDTKNHYWEDLYIKYIDQLDMYIKKYDDDVIKEFDSLEELRTFDSEYINNVDSSIFKHLCSYFNCEVKDLLNIKSIKEGLTNTSFKFTYKDKIYVYRHPSAGSEKYVNRKSEAFSEQKALELGIDTTFIYMDEVEGWKLSNYIPNLREMDYHNEQDVNKALSILKKLHSSDIESDFKVDIWDKIMTFHHYLELSGKSEFDGYDELFSLMKSLYNVLENSPISITCMCHIDSCFYNFLLDENDNMSLIDWEYSGMCDPAMDLGTFISCSDYTYEETMKVLENYLEHEISHAEKIHYCGYIAIASYFWFLWALFQETRGNYVGEWLFNWYLLSKKYATLSLNLSESRE